MIEELEQQLDSFDPAERSRLWRRCFEKVQAGEIALPEPGRFVNLHCHTFFSYNAYGYSPTKFAWLARKAGLAVAARRTSTCSTRSMSSARPAGCWA